MTSVILIVNVVYVIQNCEQRFPRQIDSARNEKRWERTSPRFHLCWVIVVNELPQRKRGLYPAPPPSLLLTAILYFTAHSGFRIRNLSKKVKMQGNISAFTIQSI